MIALLRAVKAKGGGQADTGRHYHRRVRDGLRGRLGLLGDPLVADTAVAAFVTVIAVAQQSTATGDSPGTRSLGLTFAVLYPLALILRRRWPVAVLAVLLTALVVWGLLEPVTSGAGIQLMVALYTVAAYRPFRTSLAALAGTILILVGHHVFQGIGVPDIVEAVAAFSAAWWLGDNARRRRSQSDALAAYAAELAATREELAERRVAEERLRIAREMHDVVAHSLGVVALQAGVAEHLLEEDPPKARRAVQTIAEVARSGLGDMRRALGLLRAFDGDSERQASPRLADVPRLVTEMSDASHLDIQLEVSGTPPVRADPALELSVYRVVQEALTNAGKHAPGSHVTVKMRYGADEVGVEVTDDGIASHAVTLPGSGSGLIGMRERVGMLGGSFEAARRNGGGFRVAARFPLAGEAT